MDNDQQAHEFLQAYLADQRMDEVQRYAAKGRSRASVDTAMLADEWVKDFGAWCHDHTNERLRRRWEDAEAELSLRGVAAPIERVESEVQFLIESQRKFLNETKADPERWAEFQEAFGADMVRFARSIDEASEN